MKILVVEDDPMVAKTVELLLSSYSYAVDIAGDGEVGLQMADAFEYDLVLLDVLLPQLDGISLCQQLRRKGFQHPILLLTGQGGGHQKAIALNAGADDYVVKPFDAEELIARVQALLRRGSSPTQPILAWGNLSIDPGNRKVTYGTHLLSVTPKEYAILELLLRNHQKAFNAKAILDHAWTSLEFPGEEAVRGHIKALRDKLTAVGAPKDWIKTVHRVGYQLNPQYSEFLAAQSEPQMTVPQIAELKSVNVELRAALEQLRSTQMELRQKNQELELAYQTIKQERHQLQMVRDELELRVAERKAELAQTNFHLQQQYHQWQALFDHALDAIVIADDDGCYVDANPAACELFGVSRAELLRSSVTNFADPDLDSTQPWQQFLQQGRMSGEFCLYRPDGTTRQAEFTAIAHFVPGRHLSILRDISDRKQVEDDRKQSEIELREMSIALSNAVEGISRLDEQGRYIFVNDAYARMVGYSPAELIGMNRTITIHPDDRDSVVMAYQQHMLNKRKVELEVRGVRKDGSVFDKQLFMVAVDDHQQRFIGHFCFSKDVSDRKRLEADHQQAEADLKHSEQKLRAVFDSTFQFMGVLTPEGIVMDANRAALDAVAVDLADVVGKPFWETPWWSHFPEQQQQLQQAIARAATGEFVRFEAKHMRADGTLTFVDFSLKHVFDQAGKVIMLIPEGRDITERVQLEAQFYRAQRLESLGTLASGIAHDLNNVLTPILSVSQLLRLKQPDLETRSQEMLRILENSARRGANMVKQILTFTRGTGGDPIPLQIVPLMREVVKVVQQTFPKSIKVRETIPDQPLGLVSADPTYLHQVLINLCVNARDAMLNGGILTLSIENCFVDERFAHKNLDAQVGSYVLITVADTGMGIAPELRDRIFEPFFTTKEPGQGTGLGLSTVLGIVKTYEGFVQVFSEVGQGSQFKVYLPTIGEAFTAIEQEAELLQGNGELVLIVDDDLAVQQTSQSLLESHQYTTLVANDGIEAIALYTKHHAEINVVLIDVMMPNMDGIATVRALHEINPTVKIIAISGLSSNREPILSAGANVFLPKPYTLDDLLRSLHTLIS
ncbi:MAG: PAS domain S-box protein [Leptolyngbyaceae cyanobacterium RU_5_1]|nr:PAS domain S-box protein [Leptolyngbyaceae cyanobacterium RU_5_1]